MRRVLVALTVTATLGLAAPVAHADRAPTRTERKALARASQAPSKCLLIYVSPRSTRWASVTIDHDAGKACDRLGDGTQFYRRKSKGKPWRSVTGTSDCSRPGDIPRSVWRDLKPFYCKS